MANTFHQSQKGMMQYGLTCMNGEPKYKLIHESVIQLCVVNHASNVINKIMNMKLLRKIETHHLVLSESTIYSRTPTGNMECPIPYCSIMEVHPLTRWQVGQNCCLRISMPSASIILQASNVYTRDQWLHSIQWKRAIHRFKKLLCNASRPDVFMREVKAMIQMTRTSPLQDQEVFQAPLDIISDLLSQNDDILKNVSHESIITAVAPLLEDSQLPPEICLFFSKHCRNSPRSSVVIDLFTPVVHRILKHNMNPRLQTFVRDYVLAVGCKNDAESAIQTFVASMHGPASDCPHPRVLPNLVSMCLASIAMYYQETKACTLSYGLTNEMNMEDSDSSSDDGSLQQEDKLICFLTLLKATADYEDWLPNLSGMLLPIPVPKASLSDSRLTKNFEYIMRKFVQDSRCEVHTAVCAVRDGKPGWLDLYCPGGLACTDDGQLFTEMLERLIACCCRRKRFLQSVNSRIYEPCLRQASNKNLTCLQYLCLLLEFDALSTPELKEKTITALQKFEEGKNMYTQLLDKQSELSQLREPGGPHSLVLPSKSTDADLKRMFSEGPLGDLETLNLAFTHITSACAQTLVKLPNLKHLNLWSTQFGDSGLETITEHLHHLESLNLCETQVTDAGLRCLTDLKQLKRLDLNSTPLTAKTLQILTNSLPNLQWVGTEYTEVY
ncbi:C-Maf-inducing protein-like isoform X2 [Antedon mediterranea]|uniref:C-Maf-inducing protein-like isoform X2 n=1 Tax=Antedon mediterranea TaxID=105859 RepID=UPI003AF8894D